MLHLKSVCLFVCVCKCVNKLKRKEKLSETNKVKSTNACEEATNVEFNESKLNTVVNKIDFQREQKNATNNDSCVNNAKHSCNYSKTNVMKTQRMKCSDNISDNLIKFGKNKSQIVALTNCDNNKIENTKTNTTESSKKRKYSRLSETNETNECLDNVCNESSIEMSEPFAKRRKILLNKDNNNMIQPIYNIQTYYVLNFKDESRESLCYVFVFIHVCFV